MIGERLDELLPSNLKRVHEVIEQCLWQNAAILARANQHGSFRSIVETASRQKAEELAQIVQTCMFRGARRGSALISFELSYPILTFLGLVA